ncbi:putative Transcriptional regulator, TetR family [Candidatus Sulfotelmatobacter kueseliae]|uniref:Putative Transcriptional regulator, TetR family n=1 Tax=Candidatus Sulfotelmatobacter kueseliae TaxID=2042962 RepID=A0A2U3L869_9BACT|nr:putative Transcriptional regulator, TetR family [Candidatus Sulfotelmatobacter kueseliae]
MPGIASNRATPPLYQRHPQPRPRSEVKRACIVEAATQQFAKNGYDAVRIGDIAAVLGIAKGSIFQHFRSKDGLFFEVYKQAVRSFPKYLDAPAEVRAAGFFSVLRYWLVCTEHLLQDDWIPYRISLLGNYGTDLALKREINRFLMAEDPYGTVSFVRFGLERHELRKDMDTEMIVSIVDWMMERFQDALLTAELDPGLFRRQGETAEKKEARIQQFLAVLQRAIGAAAGSPGRRARHQRRR